MITHPLTKNYLLSKTNQLLEQNLLVNSWFLKKKDWPIWDIGKKFENSVKKNIMWKKCTTVKLSFKALQDRWTNLKFRNARTGSSEVFSRLVFIRSVDPKSNLPTFLIIVD